MEQRSQIRPVISRMYRRGICGICHHLLPHPYPHLHHNHDNPSLSPSPSPSPSTHLPHLDRHHHCHLHPHPHHHHHRHPHHHPYPHHHPHHHHHLDRSSHFPLLQLLRPDISADIVNGLIEESLHCGQVVKLSCLGSPGDKSPQEDRFEHHHHYHTQL